MRTRLRKLRLRLTSAIIWVKERIMSNVIKTDKKILATILIMVSIIYAVSAVAKESDPQELSDEAKKYSVSMPTGSVPATTVLGISESSVPRVTNFKSISSQIAQGIGKDGEIKSAIGFEVAPYLLLNDKIKWEDYDNSLTTQILSRTTISFAAVPASKTIDASSGFGAQSIFYTNALDKARTAYSSCEVDAAGNYQNIVEEMSKKYPNSLKIVVGKSPSIDETKITNPEDKQRFLEIKKKHESAATVCQEVIDKSLQVWNATVVAAGLGWGFFSSDNNITSLKQTASVYWFTAAYGWGDGMSNSNAAGLLTLHARRATDERIVDPSDANNLLSEKSTLYGANLRFGSRKLGLLLEYSLRKGVVPAQEDENIKRGFVGMDVKVADDMYLSWGVGSETGKRNGSDSKFTLMNIKYAFGKQPVFTK